MSEPPETEHVEITDGDRTVAAAEVSTTDEGETARASLHAAAGHIVPGRRARLVDAVLDLPQVQDSARLEASVPLGDAESLERLRERTDEPSTRPAGSSALLDANIRPAAETKEAAEGSAD
ncbi:MAG TPA: hypothetical protein VIZ00_07805, partial [Streptosporangiaceae bacterium]